MCGKTFRRAGGFATSNVALLVLTRRVVVTMLIDVWGAGLGVWSYTLRSSHPPLVSCSLHKYMTLETPSWLKCLRKSKITAPAPLVISSRGPLPRRYLGSLLQASGTSGGIWGVSVIRRLARLGDSQRLARCRG